MVFCRFRLMVRIRLVSRNFDMTRCLTKYIETYWLCERCVILRGVAIQRLQSQPYFLRNSICLRFRKRGEHVPMISDSRRWSAKRAMTSKRKCFIIRGWDQLITLSAVSSHLKSSPWLQKVWYPTAHMILQIAILWAILTKGPTLLDVDRKSVV